MMQCMCQYMESMQAWHGWWILTACGKKMLPSCRCSLVLGLTDKWGSFRRVESGSKWCTGQYLLSVTRLSCQHHTTSLGQRVSLSEQLSLYEPHEAPVGKKFLCVVCWLGSEGSIVLKAELKSVHPDIGVFIFQVTECEMDSGC